MSTLARLRSGQLAGARRLDLNEGLSEFPREIFDLADTLEVLNLSGNRLSTLPHDLHRLRRLRVVFGSDNLFTRLPECLGACAELTTVGFKSNQIDELPAAALPPRLRWLILTDNRLQRLPHALGERPGLEKLMLAGNQLRALPDSLQDSTQLALLRMSANAFEALPRWLTRLPRLAWLAYGGNPFTRAHETAVRSAPDRPMAPWASLSVEAVLGQGASGVIHRASLTTAERPEACVALKLFKGSMTSDGLPESEMAAWLAAGEHRSLIPVQAVVPDHPQGLPGIVMPLIGPDFQPLAGPPSLDSCSRDVYPELRRFTLRSAWQLASRFAAVACHLHGRGLLHGDLYAHNTLWREDGEALLGDFGAASFLPTQDAALSMALQQLEVRAFGCLLEELLDRCETSPMNETDAGMRKTLEMFQARCLAPAPADRPLFAEMSSILQASPD